MAAKDNYIARTNSASEDKGLTDRVQELEQLVRFLIEDPPADSDDLKRRYGTIRQLIEETDPELKMSDDPDAEAHRWMRELDAQLKALLPVYPLLSPTLVERRPPRDTFSQHYYFFVGQLEAEVDAVKRLIASQNGKRSA